MCVISMSFVFSDRGLMVLDPGVQIFEPTQRAMICWNGSEEILLLSTDVHASESTMVLEVLPVPSEPAVKKGDLETFRKATDLINWSLLAADGAKGRTLSEGVVVPSAEVTFHERIGCHDISVTHLLDGDGFVAWVVQYLQTLGIEKDIVSPAMRSLIEQYIEEGFEWFVFDAVTISEEIATNEPIQYRFKTTRLFYPLKITQTAAGSTSIELLILTPRLLRMFPGLPLSRVHLKHDPVTIRAEELKEIDEDMFEMLESHRELKLRIWSIEGDLGSFTKDLIAY